MFYHKLCVKCCIIIIFYIISENKIFKDTIFASRGDYDIPPSSCICIQIIDEFALSIFTDKIFALPNHRLYREDNVFLAPNREDIKDLNLLQMNLKTNIKGYTVLEKMVLSHFHGRFIKAPEQRCVGNMCKIHHVFVVETVRSESDHLQVFYPRPIQPLYIQTKSVAYPASKETLKHFFTSFDVLAVFSENPSYSWLSSKIYHMNCSDEYNEIMFWSKLEVDLIAEICQPDNLGYTLKDLKSSTLRLPHSANTVDETSLKLLELSFS